MLLLHQCFKTVTGPPILLYSITLLVYGDLNVNPKQKKTYLLFPEQAHIWLSNKSPAMRYLCQESLPTPSSMGLQIYVTVSAGK